MTEPMILTRQQVDQPTEHIAASRNVGVVNTIAFSHEALRAQVEALTRQLAEVRAERDEKVSALNRRIDALQKAKPAFLTDYQRMWDLVRYQRSALHSEGLITNEEYALLASYEATSPLQGSSAPRRLENYDAMKAETARLTAQVAELRVLVEQLPRVSQREVVGLDADEPVVRHYTVRLDDVLALLTSAALTQPAPGQPETKK